MEITNEYQFFHFKLELALIIKLLNQIKNYEKYSCSN